MPKFHENSSSTPKLQIHPRGIDGASSFADSARRSGARGIVVIVVHTNGAQEEIACGDVTIEDLTHIGTRFEDLASGYKIFVDWDLDE